MRKISISWNISANLCSRIRRNKNASTFGDDVTKVFTDAVNLVHEKYGDKADYLQTFVCELGKAKEEKVRFWLILDEYGKNNLKVTALLPEEY